MSVAIELSSPAITSPEGLDLTGVHPNVVQAIQLDFGKNHPDYQKTLAFMGHHPGQILPFKQIQTETGIDRRNLYIQLTRLEELTGLYENQYGIRVIKYYAKDVDPSSERPEDSYYMLTITRANIPKRKRPINRMPKKRRLVSVTDELRTALAQQLGIKLAKRPPKLSADSLLINCPFLREELGDVNYARVLLDAADTECPKAVNLTHAQNLSDRIQIPGRSTDHLLGRSQEDPIMTGFVLAVAAPGYHTTLYLPSRWRFNRVVKRTDGDPYKMTCLDIVRPFRLATFEKRFRENLQATHMRSEQLRNFIHEIGIAQGAGTPLTEDKAIEKGFIGDPHQVRHTIERSKVRRFDWNFYVVKDRGAIGETLLKIRLLHSSASSTSR